MSEDEGVALAIKAIEAGKKRDIFSGGRSVAVVVIDKNGVRKLGEDAVEKYKSGKIKNTEKAK